MRSDLALIVFIGLFLLLLAVAQVARAAPVSTHEGRLGARDFTAMTAEHGNAAPAETIPDTPCIHHQPGTQCAPCPSCSTPVAEVSGPLTTAGLDVGNHDPPPVKQPAPASVFKPPRQIH
jgi:hypothetical protein